MRKSNVPMMVDPEFESMVKGIQVKIRMRNGQNISLREITKRISKLPELTNVEEKLLDEKFTVNGNFIKFDKRNKR